MKTMTCNDLGGVCDKEFHADTFEEMGEMGKKHAMEMAIKGDKAHIEKMEEMKEGMNDPKQMQEWMGKMKEKFDSLPEDK